MGKKKASGKNYESKGERPNVSKDIRKAMRREYLSSNLKVMLNKREAWSKGKRVMLTVPNPDKNNKKEKFVKVEASEIWGYYKDPKLVYRMKTSGEAE